MMGLGGLLGDVRSGPGRFLMDALGGPFGKIAERQVMQGLMADQQGQPFNNEQFARGLLSQGMQPQQAHAMLRQEDQQRHAAGQNQLQRQHAASQNQLQRQHGAAQNELYNLTAQQKQANANRSFDIQQQNALRQQQQAMLAPDDFMATSLKTLSATEGLASRNNHYQRAWQLLDQYGTEGNYGTETSMKAAAQMRRIQGDLISDLTQARGLGVMDQNEYERQVEEIGQWDAWVDPTGAGSIKGKTALEEQISANKVRINRAVRDAGFMLPRYGNDPRMGQIWQSFQRLTTPDQINRYGYVEDATQRSRRLPLKDREPFRPRDSQDTGTGMRGKT